MHALDDHSKFVGRGVLWVVAVKMTVAAIFQHRCMFVACRGLLPQACLLCCRCRLLFVVRPRMCSVFVCVVIEDFRPSERKDTVSDQNTHPSSTTRLISLPLTRCLLTQVAALSGEDSLVLGAGPFVHKYSIATTSDVSQRRDEAVHDVVAAPAVRPPAAPVSGLPVVMRWRCTAAVHVLGPL
jgi:hypothetical protein